MTMSVHDRTVLRDLARQLAEIAARPEMAVRKDAWTRHNDLSLKNPLILLFPEGAWCEILPQSSCTVENPDLWHLEFSLRHRLYAFEHFQDDTVVTGDCPVVKIVRNSGWGLKSQRIASSEARGAWHHDPVLNSASDMAKLRHPQIEYDEAATMKNLEFHQDLFGDILNVRLSGVPRLCYHLMQQYTDWRGMEAMMMDMYCEPELLHDVMAFLVAGHKSVLRQHVEQGLLELNNNNTYQGSGGNGWTTELPRGDFSGQVRPCDMWGTAESQELAQVGPDQHNEFSLRYEKELLAPFGLNAYGCCEDLTRKLPYVLQIPNIRRLSIAPWADVAACAEQLRGDYILSWKPNPAHLVGNFDEAKIRAYVRDAIAAATAHGCVMEIVLKDTHTCEQQVDRFDRWCRIAREEVERV